MCLGSFQTHHSATYIQWMRLFSCSFFFYFGYCCWYPNRKLHKYDKWYVFFIFIYTLSLYTLYSFHLIVFSWLLLCC